MALDFAGSQTLIGTVATAQGVADLLAYRGVWDAATNPATRLKGKYNLVLRAMLIQTSVRVETDMPQ
jgi:hypothetical protein